MAHKTGLEEYYSIKNNQKMRFGYTTGLCSGSGKSGFQNASGRFQNIPGNLNDTKRNFAESGNFAYDKWK